MHHPRAIHHFATWLILVLAICSCSPDTPLSNEHLLDEPLLPLAGLGFQEISSGTAGYHCLVAAPDHPFSMCKTCALICSSQEMSRKAPTGLHIARDWMDEAIIIKALEQTIEVDGLMAVEAPGGVVEPRYKSGPLLLPLHDALLESNNPHKERKILFIEPDLPAGLLVELVHTASRHEGLLTVLDPHDTPVAIDLTCAPRQGVMVDPHQTNWLGRPKKLTMKGVQWMCEQGHAPLDEDGEQRTHLTLMKAPRVMPARYFSPADASDVDLIELAIDPAGFKLILVSKMKNTHSETVPALDYTLLSSTLERWREAHPGVDQLIIVPGHDVPADVVLRAMSTAYFARVGQSDAPLFSRVALSNASLLPVEEIVNCPFEE